MKKLILPILIFFTSLSISAQSKLDIRIGLARTIQGTGDYWMNMIENELNYDLTNLFTVAGSVAFAKSNQIEGRSSSFRQGNLNLFFTPWGNDRRYELRLGSGISYYEVTSVHHDGSYNGDSNYFELYNFRNETSFGYNIIIENSFHVTDRILVGLKAFTQPYQNSDINSGFMLKTGFRI